MDIFPDSQIPGEIVELVPVKEIKQVGLVCLHLPFSSNYDFVLSS